MSVSWFTYHGINVAFQYAGSNTYGWTASLAFHDSAFAVGNTAGAPVATQGTLSTRYVVTSPDGAHETALAAAAEAVIEDAERMGLVHTPLLGDPSLLWADGTSWEGWDALAPLSKDEALAVVDRVNKALAVDAANS